VLEIMPATMSHRRLSVRKCLISITKRTPFPQLKSTASAPCLASGNCLWIAFRAADESPLHQLFSARLYMIQQTILIVIPCFKH